MSSKYPYHASDEPVSGYRLVAFLGRGGFGEVWKATAPGGTETALKIINLGAAPGLKEFRSLRLVKRIRHPNLVPIGAFWLKDKEGELLDDAYAAGGDLGTAQTTAVLARQTIMPDIRPAEPRREPAELIIAMGLGQMSLFDRLRQCQEQGLPGLPDDELLEYMTDAARAIDYLNRPVHDLGAGRVAIQHCDIKPHNMLVVGGAVQLCDFGLACILGDVRTTSAAAGTIAYAAPECLRDGKPSAATDQYSLAVSYYELKTGALPFDGESFVQVSNAVLKGTLNLSRLPAAQQAVIRRATLLDPAKRYASAGEMVDALAHAAQPGAAVPKRRRTSVTLVLALAAAVLLGGLALWQLLPAPTPPPGPTGHELAVAAADEAKTLVQKGQALQAISLYTRAIDHDPQWADAHYARGMARLSLQETSDSLDDFEEAGRLDPKRFGTHEGYAQAHLLRGQSLFDDGEFDRAVAELSEVVEKHSSFAQLVGEARLLRGRAELQQKNYDAALADFEQLKADDPARYDRLPERAEALFERGRVHLGANEFDPALVDFAAAKEADPARYGSHAQYAQAYVGLGQARLDAGANDEALADFTAAIDDHAQFAGSAYRWRGGCWLAKQEYAKAVADLNKAIEIDQADYQAYLDRGVCRLEQEDFDGAVGDFTLASKLKPDDPRPYGRRGAARLRADKDLGEAIADFTQEIKLKPEALAYINRGLAHQAQGELEGAIDDFSEALKLDANNAEAYLDRGLARQAHGDLDTAMHDFDEAIRLDKQSAKAHLARGVTAALRGDFPRAIDDFKQTIALEPDNADAYVMRGLAQIAPSVALYEEALADFTKASELSPEAPEPHRQVGWLLATCPWANVRDGTKAIAAATEACRLTEWRDASCLDTLAAAHAEAGDFLEAAKQQKQAIELAPEENRAEYRARLELYRRGKPYHLEPPTSDTPPQPAKPSPDQNRKSAPNPPMPPEEKTIGSNGMTLRLIAAGDS